MGRVIEVASQATEDHHEWRGLPEYLELTKDEERLLRHLDKFCRRPCEESSLTIPLGKWPEGEKMGEELALLMGQLMAQTSGSGDKSSSLGVDGSRPGTLRKASDKNYRGMVINLWITQRGGKTSEGLIPDVVEQIPLVATAPHHGLEHCCRGGIVVACRLLADVLSILSTLGIITQNGHLRC